MIFFMGRKSWKNTKKYDKKPRKIRNFFLPFSEMFHMRASYEKRAKNIKK